MTYFLRNGNRFAITSESNVDIRKNLPVGNYVIKITPKNELYLESVESFTLNTKLYGDTVKNTKRIINTFMSRSSSTGVMLAGEKGSGKSLLAKTVSMEAAKQQIPTLIVNTPMFGDEFNTFIQSIDQPAIVLFDEFEKVYDRDEQEALLTLLDGVFPSKKLFMITVNDKWRVDTHMRNRPGRIFYMLDFEGLAPEFIAEYCHDNLTNKSYIDRVCKLSTAFGAFNFDMLKALVEEMNRYDETPDAALQILNIRPEFSGGNKFDVSIQYENTEFAGVRGVTTEWSGNPLNFENFELDIPVSVETITTGKKPRRRVLLDGSEWTRFSWNQNDLLEVSQNSYIFVNKMGGKLTLTKQSPNKSSYLDAF
jgi:hypothetical protein